MSELNAQQRQALTQLRDLTNGGDDEVAINVLESVGWDVHRAADLIFGTVSTSSLIPPITPMPIQVFDIDDSLQGEQPRPRLPTNSWSLYFSFRPFLSVLAFPLHILSNIFRFVFGVLRIPIPQLRFSTLNLYRPLPRRPVSRGGSDRWVRELEEETGAVCIGRANVPRGLSTSSATNSAGPSSLTARPRVSSEDRKLLPDFVLGSYDEALRTCRDEARIGCIILVSEEHDDVTEFKRATLTDSTFVKLLYDNNILVWGGDVQDQEAWSAAEKLQATTYPFVAFLALQPRRSPSLPSRSAISQPPSLTVLSRHQGPPASSTSSPGPTSAHTLIDHLTNQVLPRVTSYLERIHASHKERERDRQLREEQDQAFNDSVRRDTERIRSKMEEDRKERDRIKAKKEEDERKIGEQREKAKKDAVRMEWRRWTRRIEKVKGENASVKELRISIRLPSGARVMRMFDKSSTLTALYIYVDTNLIPSEYNMDEDPLEPPEDGYWKGDLEDCIEARIARGVSGTEWWCFQLALAYPRKEIPWKSGVSLGDIESLKGGGHIVVELLGHQASSTGDDGYDTEDSE
ncbi:hypothetical protein BDZ94DRAFT_1213664 [Collybia nuda]|uniref:UBX domain-containing protein n=1 Tax=Collybia nuda TaxID=64659 RepID=A0A9P5YAR6_9AGAR|nr:hypothetical protein BDZ94DRAFT_1213664 [Collybia nuda]